MTALMDATIDGAHRSVLLDLAELEVITRGVSELFESRGHVG